MSRYKFSRNEYRMKRRNQPAALFAANKPSIYWRVKLEFDHKTRLDTARQSRYNVKLKFDAPLLSLKLHWRHMMKHYVQSTAGIFMSALVVFALAVSYAPLLAQEHTPDQHTLLLLHFNDDLNGAQGETPTQAQGVAFESGIFGNGAYFAPGNQVYFPSADNINSTEGSLEFWIKPRWNGNDGQNRVVLRYGNEGGVLFFKDGGNYWRSIFNRYGFNNPEIGAGLNVSAEWLANQWHHCAFTWNSTVLNLYVDGVLRAVRETSWALNVVNEATFQLGAEFDYYNLDAVLDELRLSDIERSAQEIQASFLASQADPFTVTNTSDNGPGSLRQVILNANAVSGREVIRFDIPGSGPHTIAPLSALPEITDPVVLDGTTQPGFSGRPIIELEGSNAGEGTNGLHITAGNSTVKGLVINRFNGNGIFLGENGGNVIKGNYIGTDLTGTIALGNADKGVNVNFCPNNTIGGTNAAARNILSGNHQGVALLGSSSVGNLVQGNFIGTDVSGTMVLGNLMQDMGVDVVDASNNTIGGTSAGARNIISGNNTGIRIVGNEATANKVQGNYIGPDVTGNVAVFNFTGIEIAEAHNNLIGGTSAAARNVISGNKTGVGILDASGNKVQGNFIGTNANGTQALGNTDDGVDIPCGYNNIISDNVISANLSTGVVIRCHLSTGNLVQRNFIGTDKSGKNPLGNGEFGVALVDNTSNNTIGGTSRSEGNVIAFNSPVGVFVHSSAGNAILSNSIFSNSGLGIDLNGEGVTPNDDGDGDAEANNLQNFPVLTVVATGEGKKALHIALNSAANTAFTLQFFANRSCDPSAHGEGEIFLLSRQATTDNNGNADFQVAAPNGVPEGFHLTATATDPQGNTSEFSRCAHVSGSIAGGKDAEADLDKAANVEENFGAPEQFALLQNYPNPFSAKGRGIFGNPETEIHFALPQAERVVIKIFNLRGEEVRTLVNEERAAGLHAVRWEGKDKNGKPVASGVYLYQLRAGSFSQVRKMSLLW